MNESVDGNAPVYYCSECSIRIVGPPIIVRGLPFHDRCLQRAIECELATDEDYYYRLYEPEIGGES